MDQFNEKKIEDFFAKTGNVQGIYLKGKSTYDFYFNVSRMVYSTEMTDDVIYVDFSDTPSSIPTNIFRNICRSINAGDIKTNIGSWSPASTDINGSAHHQTLFSSRDPYQWGHRNMPSK
jgi:hypothetical protein